MKLVFLSKVKVSKIINILCWEHVNKLRTSMCEKQDVQMVALLTYLLVHNTKWPKNIIYRPITYLAKFTIKFAETLSENNKTWSDTVSCICLFIGDSFICLLVSLLIYIYICLFVCYLFIVLFIYLIICSSFCLYSFLNNVYLFIFVINLFVYFLFINIYLFICLFP